MKVSFKGGRAFDTNRYECMDNPARVYHRRSVDCQIAAITAFLMGVLVRHVVFHLTKADLKIGEVGC